MIKARRATGADAGELVRLRAVMLASMTGEERLSSPGNPEGLFGYVFNVATDPAHRRRGYSRACVTALVDWYRERGVGIVDLRASAAAEPLYASLGFVRAGDPAMRLRLACPSVTARQASGVRA